MWRQALEELVWRARVAGRVLRHRDTPWTARAVAAGALGYLVSPVQLIPSFIPIIGQLDDAAVLAVGTRWLERLTPPEVLAACGVSGSKPTTRSNHVEAVPRCDQL